MAALTQCAFGTAVTTLFHPIAYAKVLIQVKVVATSVAVFLVLCMILCLYCVVLWLIPCIPCFNLLLSGYCNAVQEFVKISLLNEIKNGYWY